MDASPRSKAGLSMTFTAAFCMKTIFEMASNWDKPILLNSVLYLKVINKDSNTRIVPPSV